MPRKKESSIGDLPKKIQLFPYYGNIVMPGVNLPIPFSSPDHALPILSTISNKNSLIGLVQPISKSIKLDPYYDDLDELSAINDFTELFESHLDIVDESMFFKTGTLAAISDIIKVDEDGTEPLAIMHGICRFNIKNIYKPEEGVGYFAEVEYDNFNKDLEEKITFEFDREKLIKKLAFYLKKQSNKKDLEMLSEVSDEKFLHAVCMMLPLNAIEKQAFLEEPKIIDQLDIIHKLVEMNDSKSLSFKIH